MISNGQSFSGDNSSSSVQGMNGSPAYSSDPRNTEPFFWRYLQGIQPGALI